MDQRGNFALEGAMDFALERFKDSFLNAAAKAGSEEEVSSLVDLGADVNWVSPEGDGDTALLAACRNGHRTVVEMLVALGADCGASSGRGRDTALHLACRRGDEPMATMLVEQSPRLDARDSSGGWGAGLVQLFGL